MWGRIITLVIAAFLLGFVTHSLILDVNSAEIPQIEAPAQTPLATLERPSPHDRIQEQDIHVLPDQVIIDLKDAQWSTFTDTNSMDPIIDAGANAIQRVPRSEDDIHVGDIISYEPTTYPGIVIHRVISVGNDGQWYAVTKGDNNPYPDPQKVRFSQIKRVLVAVIY